MHYLILMFVLYLFWLILSGHFTLFFFSLGLVSIVLVTWIQKRMDLVDNEPAKLNLSFRLINYGLWLSWKVILSNIDVVRRVWDPTLPATPVWEKLDVQIKSSREQTLYANSITLTPGTLTTDVGDGYFLIHSLSPEGIAELKTGEMEKQIKKLRI